MGRLQVGIIRHASVAGRIAQALGVEPAPEETTEAPELGSLRSAAEQSKLLPER